MLSFKAIRNTGLILLTSMIVMLGLVPSFIVYYMKQPSFIVQSEISKVSKLEEIEELISDVRFSLVGHKNSSFLSKYEVSVMRDTCITTLNLLLSVVERCDYPAFLAALGKDVKILRTASLAYIEECQYDPAGSAAQELKVLLNDSFDRLEETVSLLFDESLENIRSAREAFFVIALKSRRIAFLGLLVGVILGLFVSLWMARSLSELIQKLVNAAKKIGAGDLYTVVPVESKDELGHVSMALESMRVELKRFRSELFKEKRKVERANKAKDILLANASHELRTPLTAILGYAHLLDKGNAHSEYIKRIIDEASVLKDLINTMLDLTRIETGTYMPHFATFNPAVLMKKIYVRHKEYAEKKNINFNCEISDRVPELILSDELSISQIISNFVSNALKFTDQGKVSIKVDFIEGSSSSVMRVAVKDSGIGIPRDKQEYIFGEFKQLDEGDSREHGGVGLGLHIVKMLAEIINGKVGVNSEKGVGSEFWCEVPVTVSHSNMFEYDKEEDTEENVLIFKKVLFVEDYEATRDVIALHLRNCGYDIVTAVNGQEAIDFCRQSKFDLILMDVQMPGVDGLSASKQIRETTINADVPIVALTARLDELTIRKCEKIGIDKILAKPILLDSLTEFLATYKQKKTSNVNKKQVVQDNSDDPICVDDLLKLFADDKPAAFKSVKRFTEKLDQHLILMKKMLDEKSFDSLAKEAHKVCGGAYTLAMNSLAESLKELEKSALIEDEEEIYKIMTVIGEKSIKIKSWIDKYL